MRSIERYLLVWVIGALALGSVVVALATYLVLLDEMNEVFDADLRNIARAVAVHDHSDHSTGVDLSPPPSPARPDADPPDNSLITTQTWSRSGKRVFASDPGLALPFSTVEGISRTRIGGEAWIVYTTVDADGVVKAAQRASARRELAAESAAKVMPPLLGMMVLVGGMLVFALRRGLRPLDATAHDIGARSAKALDPIPTADVPREITPLVNAINALMRRLFDALARQRRFLADAAHELRTPVTALRLQLQLLQGSDDAPAREEAVGELAMGIERMSHLIEQLLAIARSEPDAEALRVESLDLGELARSVVGSLSLKAEHLDIDLGAGVTGNVEVLGDRHALTILLNNLVENALRYTPAGGVVDVRTQVERGLAVLAVVDDGPGIPESERERVFDRFYRGDDSRALDPEPGGSGLGLAIVRSIAERHGATVSLHVPQSGRGLEVRIVFASLTPPW